MRLGKGLHEGGFLDYGAAAHVDDHGGGFHGGEFGRPQHAAGVFGERSGGHDVVAALDHFDAVVGGVDLLDQGIHVVERGPERFTASTRIPMDFIRVAQARPISP